MEITVAVSMMQQILMAAEKYVVGIEAHAGMCDGQGKQTIRAIEEVPDSATSRERATILAKALSELGYRGESIVLALPSRHCYCGTISTEGLQRQDRRQAMLYRLEEKLPLAAEEIVADYIARNGATALGVCAQIAPLKSLVDALESEGVAVQAICPAALLAVTGAVARGELKDADAVLWGADDQIELIVLVAGRPVSWSTLPKDAEDNEPFDKHVERPSISGRRLTPMRPKVQTHQIE